MDNRLKEFNAIYRECIIDRLNLLLERLKEYRENEEKMTYPFSVIDNKIIPDPESFILIMISKYRDSKYSDKELARYITKGLAATLYLYDAHIEQYRSAEGLEFKSNNTTSTQSTKLTKLLRLLRLRKL